jgi:hypothetical protein
MNTITIYQVSTEGNVRLETLNRDEAIQFAQTIYNGSKAIADITEQTATPTDHTKKVSQ